MARMSCGGDLVGRKVLASLSRGARERFVTVMPREDNALEEPAEGGLTGGALH